MSPGQRSFLPTLVVRSSAFSGTWLLHPKSNQRGTKVASVWRLRLSRIALRPRRGGVALVYHCHGIHPETRSLRHLGTPSDRLESHFSIFFLFWHDYITYIMGVFAYGSYVGLATLDT